MIRSNPNASVAAVAGAITILVVYLVGFAGVSVPAEASSAITTLVATAILLAGRRRR